VIRSRPGSQKVFPFKFDFETYLLHAKEEDKKRKMSVPLNNGYVMPLIGFGTANVGYKSSCRLSTNLKLLFSTWLHTYIHSYSFFSYLVFAGGAVLFT
jgi:hypothetical protein